MLFVDVQLNCLNFDDDFQGDVIHQILDIKIFLQISMLFNVRILINVKIAGVGMYIVHWK